jgi:succinate dehydrogenase / fumarate reductase, iron-sulfur subunit
MAMQVGLKVWRYNSQSGERELQEYEISAPEEATLLDCLDIVKDQHDGTLGYRKSCRMMICGSCGMRMDGAAVLACQTRMYDVAQAGHVPVISAMGNLPIVKDLVVDMGPFWEKFRSVDPYLQPGYDEPPDGKEYRITQQRMNVIHKEALCINCGCCVSECNAMEADPRFTGPQALAKAMRFVGDPRDGNKIARLEKLNGEHGIWECTRCYFCNERCPKGVDPRDAIAKLGAESMHEGIDRDMGAKHARWFVVSAKTTGWLRETELVPKTQGIVSAIKQTRFALDLARKGKVPPPFPPHVAKDVKESRRLHDLSKDGPQGYMGIVQGERALARLAHGHTGEETVEEIYERPGAFLRPYIADEAPAGGSEGGQGSLTQADVTPGEKPTKKPEGGA